MRYGNHLVSQFYKLVIFRLFFHGSVIFPVGNSVASLRMKEREATMISCATSGEQSPGSKTNRFIVWLILLRHAELR